MAVFGTVVRPFVRPMIEARRTLSPGSTIRPQRVREGPLGNETKMLYQAAQEPYCGRRVPFRLEYFFRECQFADPAEFVWLVAMKIPAVMPRLKGFLFPREIIAYAVLASPALSSRTSCAAKSNRSFNRPRTPITAPTTGSINGWRARTDLRGSERSSWAGSSRQGRRSVSCPPMTRSIRYSGPAATVFPPPHTATPDAMLLICGRVMPSK